MDKKRWVKIEPILDRALSISNAEERREYVREACEKRQLQREVYEMIYFIEKAKEAGFLE